MSEQIKKLLHGFPVVFEQPVVWGEMDAYQHVNNVAYFRYIETVRMEYLRRLDWKQIEEETGVGPIVSELRARFRRPLHYPDTISIAARLGEMKEDRFTLKHIIVSHKLADVATEGESTVVTFNYREGCKAKIPEEMRKRIEALETR